MVEFLGQNMIQVRKENTLFICKHANEEQLAMKLKQS